MTQEQKDLLLQDLCARLPYGVKCLYTKIGIFSIIGMDLEKYSYILITNNNGFRICENELKNIKPYLFPLSSMIEEQRQEVKDLGWNFDNFEIHNVNECIGTYREYVAHSDCSALIDLLNKNHFDYRGLIKKGLAIDATGLNIY